MSRTLKGLVSKRKKRFREDGFDLDLSYISDRIIAMGFPAEKLEGVYRNHIDDVVRFLQTRHSDHYKIYHLCDERDFDSCRFAGPVAKYPFHDHNAPQFEQIIALCEDAKRFLDQDSLNVVAINCKAGKGRTGVMVCACLLRLQLALTATDALRFYGERRTDDGKGVTIPSQRRYVQYYDNFLKKNLVYSRTPLRLREIQIEGINSQSGFIVDLKVRTYCSMPTFNNRAFIRSKPTRASFDRTDSSRSSLVRHDSKTYRSNSPSQSGSRHVDAGVLQALTRMSCHAECGLPSEPLVTIASLSSHVNHHGQAFIRIKDGLPLAGDVCVTVSLRLPVLRRKLCRLWFNTFFVVLSAHKDLLLLNGLKRQTDSAQPAESDAPRTDIISAPFTPVEEVCSPGSHFSKSPNWVERRVPGLSSPDDRLFDHFGSSLPIQDTNSRHVDSPVQHFHPITQSCAPLNSPQSGKLGNEIKLKLGRSELDKVTKSLSARLLSRNFTITLVFHTSDRKQLKEDDVSNPLPPSLSPRDDAKSHSAKTFLNLSKGGSILRVIPATSVPFIQTRSLRLPERKDRNLPGLTHVNSLSDPDEPSSSDVHTNFGTQTPRIRDNSSAYPREIVLRNLNVANEPSTDDESESESDSDTDTFCSPSDTDLNNAPLSSLSLDTGRGAINCGAQVSNRQSRSLGSFSNEPISNRTVTNEQKSTVNPYTSTPVKHHFIRHCTRNQSPAIKDSEFDD